MARRYELWTVARLAGERRVGPGRHLLTGEDGSLLAVFDTHAVARVVENRPTRVTDAGGREICSLVPAEGEVAGLGKKWRR